MNNSKKEILKNFLLDGDDNKKRDNFELAWDIWENFGAIKQEISLDNIIRPLANKIKELIDEPYEITSVSWCDIYVAKAGWRQTKDDKGIYALGISKWDKWPPFVGIRKDSDFTTNAEKELEKIRVDKAFGKAKPYLVYIDIPDGNWQDNKAYYTDVFLNPNKIVEILFDSFEKLYRTIRDTEGLEELLDGSVEERKAQLGSSSNN